jgi:hypothetical protein
VLWLGARIPDQGAGISKLNLRYLYAAAAGAAIAAAAIAIPAGAASGGSDSGAQSQTRRAPLPPLPGAFGLSAKAPSAAQARRMRSKLDDFASCMRKQGADVPGVRRHGRGVSIQVPRPQSRAVMRKVAKECGMPPPPPPGQFLPSRKQIEKNRRAIARGDCPVPPPFAAPRRR